MLQSVQMGSCFNGYLRVSGLFLGFLIPKLRGHREMQFRNLVRWVNVQKAPTKLSFSEKVLKAI